MFQDRRPVLGVRWVTDVPSQTVTIDRNVQREHILRGNSRAVQNAPPGSIALRPLQH